MAKRRRRMRFRADDLRATSHWTDAIEGEVHIVHPSGSDIIEVEEESWSDHDSRHPRQKKKMKRRKEGRKFRYVFDQITAIAPKAVERLTESELNDYIDRSEVTLVYTDPIFFATLRSVYRNHFCGFWRRWFSLKTLRSFKLIRYTRDLRTRHEIWDEDPRYVEDLLFFYRNPSEITSQHRWIRRIFRLRQPKYRHALQFVEGWSSWRVAIAGSIPGVVSSIVAVVWATKGGELSVVFTVSAFILAAVARGSSGELSVIIRSDKLTELVMVGVVGLVSETED